MTDFEAQLQRELDTRCPEPHHAHEHDEKAHRWHHWKERLFCLSCCTALHFALEYYSHVSK